jgi:hypothetical protein
MRREVSDSEPFGNLGPPNEYSRPTAADVTGSFQAVKSKPPQSGSETRMHAMMPTDRPSSDMPHPQLEFCKRHPR